MPPPRLAILLPAYAPGPRLATTLESIAAQDIACEIFVVDDGSAVPVQVPARVGQHLVHLIRLEENGGIARALNVGLEAILARADFEYIARHDVGDVDLNDRLRRQLEFLDANPAVAIVGSSARWVDARGVERFEFKARSGHGAITRKMRYSAALVHSSCMFRESAMRQLGRYSEDYDCAEDYELFFRFLRDFEVANLPDALVQADYNPDGISLSRRRRSLHSRLRLQLRFFAPLSIHSYFGVCQTLGLFVIPYGLVSRLKRALGRQPASATA